MVFIELQDSMDDGVEYSQPPPPECGYHTIEHSNYVEDFEGLEWNPKGSHAEPVNPTSDGEIPRTLGSNGYFRLWNQYQLPSI